MLLSMTGFGEAHVQVDGLAVAVEIRTINNRHYKLTTRLAEGYALLEPQIDALIRQRIRRGTVQVNVRLARRHRPDDYRLNVAVLRAYCDQLEQVRGELRLDALPSLEALLQLPGVVDENIQSHPDAEADWPLIQRTLGEALERLSHMRHTEGQTMAVDLKNNCRQVSEALDRVEQRASQVSQGYRARLQERLRKMLDEHGVTVETADILREVSIFAERSDVSEEIIRLRSHVDQFSAVLDLDESSGRKLEFVTQEMFREANTIGSKANDVQISHDVIEIKTAIERIREMIQNIE